MSRQRPILGWIALLVGALATLRVVLFAFLDRSPRFGGSEANELKLLVFYHRPFRASIEGHRFVDFGALRSMIEAEAHQPPLWYVGVPALFAGSESLSYGPLLLTNAAALALALWAAWQFGTRQGRPLLGLLGVVVLSSLPLVAGRVTLLGVEPWHMALLGLTLGLFLRVREGDATRRHAVLLGVVVAAGLLMKLTFLAALLGPLLLECSAALRGGRAAKQWRLRLLEAAAVALVLGLVCFLPFTGPGKIAAAAGVEPSHESVLSLESLLFLPGLFWEEMGLGECVLLAMALLGAWLSRGGEGGAPHLGCRPTTLLLASVLSLFAIHALVPHKEVRYLLPAAWAVSLLLGVGLEALCVRGPWQRAAVAVTLLLLLAGLIPQYDTTPPDYEHLRFHLDPSDHGIEALVCHESLRGPAGARVLTFLEGPRESFLRDMIEWEAYGRNEHPVVPLGSLTSLLGEAAEQRLGEASHLITNRRLEPAEREQLERLGFVELEVVELLFSRPPTWSLWGPPSVQDPSEQGPSEQGPSVQGPSAQGSSAGPCPAGMVSLLGGTFALGEGSSLPELQPPAPAAVIRRSTFEIAPYCIDEFPFPGTAQSVWPEDGLSAVQARELDRELRRRGRRLCTVSELLLAAAGPENWRYPYHPEEWAERLCDPDDAAPGPIGSRAACRSPVGVADFGVRSCWARLEAPMREHLGTYGSPVGPPHLGGETPEDTEYVVFGGTSRRDTFYANNNFGIHAHALDEEGSYLDDSTRVCRDPGPVVAVEERAYRSWLRAFEVSGRFEALLERAAR